MPLSCSLQCFNKCCDKKYDITCSIYNCPKCGSLLDVVHNINELKKINNKFTWELSHSLRKGKPENHLHNSGVWRFHEFVMPSISHENVITTYEGNNPLLQYKNLKQILGLDSVHVKLSGNNYTGSFKDLGMTVLVSVVNDAIKKGKKIKAIGCASTGDTSASLSMYSAIAGIPSVIFLPKNKVSTAQLIQPIATGSKVFALDTDFDGCMKLVQKLAENGHIYLANSKNALRIEGQKTIAFELYENLNYKLPDWIVLPSGNLGNAYALFKGFKLLKELKFINKLPRLLLAQSSNANPLYRAFINKTNIKPTKAKNTLATAIQIGDPVSAPRAMLALRETNGVVEQATDQELSDISAKIDNKGLYTCPHTAVAFASLKKAIDKGIIKNDEIVVVISTANALKFTEFKLNYHMKNIPDIKSKFSNSVIDASADYDDILKLL